MEYVILPVHFCFPQNKSFSQPTLRYPEHFRITGKSIPQNTFFTEQLSVAPCCVISQLILGSGNTMSLFRKFPTNLDSANTMSSFKFCSQRVWSLYGFYHYSKLFQIKFQRKIFDIFREYNHGSAYNYQINE